MTIRRLAMIVLLAVCAPAFGTPALAHAAETEDVITGSALSLTSVGDKTLMAHLVPAVPVAWQVGVAAHTTDPGVVRISLTARGRLVADPDGLQVTVRTCDVRWVGGMCPTGGTVLLGPGPASALLTGSVALTSMPSTQERWILIDASLPANPERLPTGSADLVLTASGVGDELSTGGATGSLATTGTDLWTPLLAALIAVAAGLLLAALARLIGTRHPRTDEARS